MINAIMSASSQHAVVGYFPITPRKPAFPYVYQGPGLFLSAKIQDKTGRFFFPDGSVPCKYLVTGGLFPLMDGVEGDWRHSSTQKGLFFGRNHRNLI